jgi:hypothetical protein
VLATLGQFFFRFGLAFVIISTFVAVALVITVGTVPEVLVRTSGVMSMLTGDFLSGVGKLFTYAALGLGFLGGIALIKTFFSGSVTPIQVFQPAVLAVYLGLFTIALDGCMTAINLLLDMYVSMFGTFGGAALLGIKGSVLALILISTSYYVLVKGFGAPAE